MNISFYIGISFIKIWRKRIFCFLVVVGPELPDHKNHGTLPEQTRLIVRNYQKIATQVIAVFNVMGIMRLCTTDRDFNTNLISSKWQKGICQIYPEGGGIFFILY